MDELLKALNRLNNGTKLILKFQNCEIEGSIDTIYETNNENDEDSADYAEYYACAIEVSKFIAYENCEVNYKKGELIEVSQYNSPDRILSAEGDLIWEK
ncbi:hypothetical protein [Faecalispora anaeroviscerum]|uniref:hypothetical protein n=1 Tax=Faecalispora anaeroviscerum TaxID=2991836 RepID=UPI0024BA6818|nr:hypothetical protein [Faecalispora anaeroviscerum]